MSYAGAGLTPRRSARSDDIDGVTATLLIVETSTAPI
jgi:hypothetical protein